MKPERRSDANPALFAILVWPPAGGLLILLALWVLL